jgi:glycerol uptake facilitator protein
MEYFWAELIGTMVLVLLGNGVVANHLLMKTKGHNGGWIIISAGWGFAVAMAVYITGWVSGGHYNPAVTLGLCIAKKTPWNLMPIYFLGQFMGAFIGAALVWLTYFPHWQKTPDPQMKLLCFATHPAIRNYKWNFVCEMIGTMVLLLGILGIFNEHNGIAGGMGPYAVGILIFAIGLSLGGPTGYAINPARDLGPRVAYAVLPIRGKGSPDWSYAWIPVLAPLLGGILGTLLYLFYVEPLSAMLTL